MHIGVPKEIKNHEYRVGLTPASVREIVAQGHQVSVEHNAGLAIGYTDEMYHAAGAQILNTASDIYAQAELLIKVKEPQPEECLRLRPEQILFTYLHLAADPQQTELLLASGATCIAYETVTDPQGGLPLLAPMSEVAGRLSVQAGAHHLEKAQGGAGVLLGGVPGVAPAEVLIIGGGVVGSQAAHMALGLGANVTIVDRSLARLRQLDIDFNQRVNCVYATIDTIEHYAIKADLIIGAVLIPGAAAPKLLTQDIIKQMKQGSVVVDVAIDQGGCFATSKPTTHQAPTYLVDGVVHYCVANMPGGVARTASLALNNATLPYILKLAKEGLHALQADQHFLAGLNIYAGNVTCQAVSEALNYPYCEARTVL